MIGLISLDKMPMVKLANKQNAKEGRIKGRLHWSSSPDRGLDNLLYCLPWIKEKVPEAHIACFYGLNNLQKMNPQLAVVIEDSIKVAGEDSIQFYGRVGQDELAKEWKKADVWCYATAFTETFCITAKEAQLTGTPTVCTNLAALSTTVGEYGILVEPHAYSKEAREKFISETIKLMTDDEYWLTWSKKAKEGVSRIDWKSRYEDYWSKLL